MLDSLEIVEYGGATKAAANGRRISARDPEQALPALALSPLGERYEALLLQAARCG
jgi:hypothetical protein